ncbi:MAG: beta-ketoacyl-[acyl-carrier-protein] synthase family protein [Nitrospirota bacterium]|nr:beta-ketoacyl-[acyl-carrier-protein] synthase family protein [Nitrospirota bacterium]
MEKKLAITGLGVISPLGTGRDEFWLGLRQGKTGFRKITLFDPRLPGIAKAGEITDFDPAIFLGKKGLRELDRSTRLVCSAAKLALDDAGLVINDDNSDQVGVSIGATFGSLHSISQFDRVGLTEGPRYVNPSHFPNTVINSPASQISIRFRIKGFNTTISTGFCSGLDSLIYASDFLRLKRVEAVLAGGVEELCEETFQGFHLLGCLSGSDGTEQVCCPFDRRRSGVILSEGAAVIALEDLAAARKRGADILAVVLGYGTAFDLPARKGSGLSRAIAAALSDSGSSADEIDYVSSCANSSVDLDRLETRVIREIFGGRSRAIPVSSIKSMIGESFSASGSMSLVSAVGVLKDGVIPPTINYKEKDAECDLDYVPNEARKERVNRVLVTTSDPYGQNSAVILGAYTEEM